jgi:predicted nucleic acid-binding protein
VKVLFDTNVILDVLMDRVPFAEDASFLMSMAEKGEIEGCIAATTVTTLIHLIQKALGRNSAAEKIKTLLSIFEPLPVNRGILEAALNSSFKDFEDAVLYEAGRHAGVEYILTRNVKDFRKSELPVSTPTEFMAMLKTILSK